MKGSIIILEQLWQSNGVVYQHWKTVYAISTIMRSLVDGV